MKRKNVERLRNQELIYIVTKYSVYSVKENKNVNLRSILKIWELADVWFSVGDSFLVIPILTFTFTTQQINSLRLFSFFVFFTFIIFINLFNGMAKETPVEKMKT